MQEGPSLFKRVKSTAPVRLIVASFLLIILVGSALLATPFATHSGEATHYVDALFTATSATCVTGLVPFDTWTHWNGFGQIVILFLIQIGGLGVVTFTTGFTLLARRKLGLRELQLASENTAGNTMHVYQLVKIILAFTISCELIGALVLMLRFVPQFGMRGVWLSLFIAVSAYCNAGFDILGFQTPDASLMNYAGDPLVCIPVALLIILGGLGFIVINDIYFAKLSPKFHKKNMLHLNLHSSLVLRMTLILLVIGTIGFMLFEWNNTLHSMNVGEKILASFFQSTSARTAGFASIDIAGEHDITKLFTIILMFIGAAPAGTGGGIKVTTFVVLLATVYSVMRGNEDTTIQHRRIDKSTVYKSLAIVTVGLLVVLCTTGLILSLNTYPISAVNALFEATSAFGTVGLTAGVTPHLSFASKLAVCFTMFIGRVGPISLALAIAMKRARYKGSVLPEGKIVVG
ncbi:TrkH family potassium uptake protein [Clostridium sp. D33t1_170424_F3]|uniref:TrkH family potassium uptake protein n=1 Tax=Clostridium sp. D33t1_170424_F3 TaxID=2787099 RepID=UPI0018A920CE|nr:TrkH family potassium uptake protein [Clostridium sp. D33t1_170424_F3]